MHARNTERSWDARERTRASQAPRLVIRRIARRASPPKQPHFSALVLNTAWSPSSCPANPSTETFLKKSRSVSVP